ncbi:MAG: ABC transporter ATP-binding protein [Deltaproteobacteria bacterium]|nr:ABC transporter ATP-binding protein [Deltaproteobacteria bacterium]
MSTPLLRVENLSVGVTDPLDGQEVVVVDDVSFSLGRGEVVALVGESGSGKTVLMRSLLGITSAKPGVMQGRATAWTEEGEAALAPRRPGRRRSLTTVRPGWAGYVFQHPLEALDPYQTVGRQVADSVRVARPRASTAERRERAEHWLAQVALPNPRAVAELHPHELSGGMAQRVAVAVALATEPRFLVADEPTTGLDWSVRREVLDLLARLQDEQGLTLLLITHDFAVVRHMADRVLVLYQGRLVEDGPRSAFFEPGPGEHPYSRELQARVLALEEGRPPPPSLRAPSGPAGASCPYVKRCARMAVGREHDQERCYSEVPPLVPFGDGHRVACFLSRR